MNTKEALRLRRKYRTLLKNYNIDNDLRLSHFFGQLDHESNLKVVSENLNYSWEALRRVFAKHFPTDEIAKQYHRQPEKIANRAYANRMQNGDESSGDGWRYRGRGFIQITGKANYLLLSKDTRIDYLSNPDLLLNEADAMISALWFWSKNNLNNFADADDVKGLTRMINGGFNGLQDRVNKTKAYKEIDWNL